ncbi:MAG: 2'-5' RNA ligase family protein [Pseudonocardiaceae bacterium]
MRPMAFAAGQTAIIVPVDAAEPIVGRWRRQFDPSAAAGVPAHVTIIYPFLPEQNLDEDVVRDVRRLVAHHRSFTVTFANCGQFPDVLFLVPDPDDPFRRLTAEVFQRWPEAPPYAGLITDPVPHLTITHGASRREAAEAEADVAAHLPFTCAIHEAWLIRFNGTRWTCWESLPLGAVRPA